MKLYKRFVIFSLIFFAASAAFSQIRVLSPLEGVWANRQMLVIDTDGDGDYFYSLDGSDPTRFGFAYDGPVLIDLAGQVSLRIARTGKGTYLEKSVSYTVNPDDAYTREYGPFISYFYDSGLYNYTSGSELELPSSLFYSLGLPPDSFLPGQTLSISEKSVLSRYVPCTLWDKESGQRWRFVIRTFPQTAGVFSRRDVPFTISDWSVISFTNPDLLYRIDGEYWSLPQQSRVLDRSERHIIYWQPLAYEEGNPIEYFILPPKPELVRTVTDDGAVVFSIQGDDSYTASVLSQDDRRYQELFTELGADTFWGDSISGSLDIGIFASSVYQGQLSVSYNVTKRPPAQPLISSTAADFYSREPVRLTVTGQENADLYISVIGPVPLGEDSAVYSPDNPLFAASGGAQFEKQTSSSVGILLNSEVTGAFYMNVRAYSTDGKNMSDVAEYGVIIDRYNYYFDASATSSTGEGTAANPFTDFRLCMAAINKGRSAALHIKGDATVPQGSTSLSSNLVVINEGNASLVFDEGATLAVNASTLELRGLRILSSSGYPMSDKNLPLFYLQNSVLLVDDCNISAGFGRNGTAIEASSSSVTLLNSLASVSSSSYASFLSGVNSRATVRNSSVNVSSGTAVVFSINGGSADFSGSSFKVLGEKGRIAELFGVTGRINGNEFKSELDKASSSRTAVYKDRNSSVEDSDNDDSEF